MSTELKQMFNSYTVSNDALIDKQKKLFNPQGMAKWENENIDRMNEVDKKALLDKVTNLGLILPKEQKSIWEQRFLHAHLV